MRNELSLEEVRGVWQCPESATFLPWQLEEVHEEDWAVRQNDSQRTISNS